MPAYRKTFVPSVVTSDIDVDEKFYFAPGPGPCVFDVAGVRLGIVICYDRSFPELWQSLVRMGAEVIVPVVSSLGWREQRFVDELAIRALRRRRGSSPRTVGATRRTPVSPTASSERHA